MPCRASTRSGALLSCGPDADSRRVQSFLDRPKARLAVLLALLAVIAGLAVSRIGGSNASNQHVLKVSDPQAAYRYLSRLPIPSGFQRARCQASSKPSVCFKRLPSVVLSDSSWAQIIDRLGVLVTKAGCAGPAYGLYPPAPGQRSAVNCLAFGHKGREQIWLNAVGVVVGTRSGLGSAYGNFGSVTGTYISVSDVGS